MIDTVVRTFVSEPDIAPPADHVSTDPKTVPESKVEIPFMDYKIEKHNPFTVDFYKLGRTWEDPEGGFLNEVETIESYLQKQIEDGEMANTVSAAKNRLKQIEKVIRISGDDRTVLKVGMVASYIKFLMDTEGIKKSLKKYGSY